MSVFDAIRSAGTAGQQCAPTKSKAKIIAKPAATVAPLAYYSPIQAAESKKRWDAAERLERARQAELTAKCEEYARDAVAGFRIILVDKLARKILQEKRLAMERAVQWITQIRGHYGDWQYREEIKALQECVHSIQGIVMSQHNCVVDQWESGDGKYTFKEFEKIGLKAYDAYTGKQLCKIVRKDQHVFNINVVSCKMDGSAVTSFASVKRWCPRAEDEEWRNSCPSLGNDNAFEHIGQLWNARMKELRQACFEHPQLSGDTISIIVGYADDRDLMEGHLAEISGPISTLTKTAAFKRTYNHGKCLTRYEAVQSKMTLKGIENIPVEERLAWAMTSHVNLFYAPERRADKSTTGPHQYRLVYDYDYSEDGETGEDIVGLKTILSDEDVEQRCKWHYDEQLAKARTMYK